MSQFSAPPADQYSDPYAEPPKTSAMAVWSLVCSLIFCCPVTTVLGVLLGVGAVATIGSNPNKKGKGMAFTGILLGLVFSAVQVWAYGKFYNIMMDTWTLMSERAPAAVMAGASKLRHTHCHSRSVWVP